MGLITAVPDTSQPIESFRKVSSDVQAAVARVANQAAKTLLDLVRNNLSGEVLNEHSGALQASVVAAAGDRTPDKVSISVGSDGSVPYARIQEFGGHLNIPDIVPRAAKALAFAYGGRLVFARRAAAHAVEIPGRSYLRAALAEQSASIVNDVREAVSEVLP